MHRTPPVPLRRAAARGLLACALVTAAGCNEGPTEQPPVELGEIVFCRGGPLSCSLTTINPDGSGALRITPMGVAEPSWSPDGGRIAFLDSRDQNVELYLWTRDGSMRLTRTEGRTELSPAWSPDGTRIVFGAMQSNRRGLYIINADGTGERQLLDGYDTWRPDWSPDGRSIVYQDYREVAVISVDGGEPTMLAFGESPAWSPDGTRIAFARRASSGAPPEELGIFTMAPDGTGLTRVTSGSLDDEPDWSPDGRRIVFTRHESRVELHVVNADGTGLTAVARDSARNVSPSWRP
jgi:TolB protein